MWVKTRFLPSCFATHMRHICKNPVDKKPTCLWNGFRELCPKNTRHEPVTDEVSGLTDVYILLYVNVDWHMLDLSPVPRMILCSKKQVLKNAQVWELPHSTIEMHIERTQSVNYLT